MARKAYTDPFSWFPFDVEKWFGSIATQRMSFAEKGVYLVMLFQEWRDPDRSLPDDPAAVADLIAVTAEQRAEVLAAWESVRRKFVPDRRASGRVINVAIERTRRTQRAKVLNKENIARAAGKASARKRLMARELTVNVRSTPVERPSTIREEKSRSDQRREDQIRDEASFRAFWDAFPKKVGEQGARSAWMDIAPNPEHAREIVIAAERFAAVCLAERREERFIPHPKRWLLEARWNDDLPPAAMAMALVCPHDPPCSAPGRWACQQKAALDRAKAAS